MESILVANNTDAKVAAIRLVGRFPRDYFPQACRSRLGKSLALLLGSLLKDEIAGPSLSNVFRCLRNYFDAPGLAQVPSTALLELLRHIPETSAVQVGIPLLRAVYRTTCTQLLTADPFMIDHTAAMIDGFLTGPSTSRLLCGFVFLECVQDRPEFSEAIERWVSTQCQTLGVPGEPLHELVRLDGLLELCLNNQRKHPVVSYEKMLILLRFKECS